MLDIIGRLPTETLLLRWLNYQLAKAELCGRNPRGKRVANLREDLADGEALLILMSQVS